MEAFNKAAVLEVEMNRNSMQTHKRIEWEKGGMADQPTRHRNKMRLITNQFSRRRNKAHSMTYAVKGEQEIRQALTLRTLR